MSNKVSFGTPITTEQATRAILRMLKTPIVGNVDLDSSPGYTIRRIKEAPQGISIYQMLSTGEQRLVDIAHGIWSVGADVGARINVLGGLDPDLRRRVIVVLMYLYLGRDLVLEVEEHVFGEMFRAKVC